MKPKTELPTLEAWANRAEAEELRRFRNQAAESLKACNDRRVQLEKVAQSVLDWAATSGNHGRNPYSYEFVRLAFEAMSGQTIGWRKL